MNAIQELRQTVARLRAPGGCPWDQEQTHQSICDCLVEEVAELLDTIDRGDMDHMREELGDLLLHVVMHAQMAEDEGHFDLEAVAAEVNEKLIRRHPHVFGDVAAETTEKVIVQWDLIKKQENAAKGKVDSGVFKALPPKLNALLYARDVYKQIAKQGLPAGGCVDHEKVCLLAADLSEDIAGEKLFELAAACREAGIDPESALRRHVSRIVTDVERRCTENDSNTLAER